MAETGNTRALGYAVGSLRVGLGLILAWAFFDKLIGLGYTTCRNMETGAVNVMCEQAWLNGGSPTSGFLQFATQGPFQDLFNSLAGNVLIDWLFMLGLGLIGLSLILGIGVGVAAISGALLMALMWLAVLPPQHHPFMSDHIINILALMVVFFGNKQQRLGLGRWWSNRPLVKKYNWLR